MRRHEDHSASDIEQDVDISALKLFPLTGTVRAQATWIKESADFRRAVDWNKQEGVKLRNPVLCISDGERLRFAPIPGISENVKALLSSVEHHRHGLRCICPQFTAPPLRPDATEFSSGCPVCALALPIVSAGGPLPEGLENRRYYFLPVIPHSYVDDRGRWKRFNNPSPALVRLPERIFARHVADLSRADAVWEIERDRQYSLTRLEDYRWSYGDNQNAVHHFPVPALRYEAEDLAAMAANLFNHPVPGRAADLLKALPDVVLIPAGLGSKRPCVKGWPQWTRHDSEIHRAELDDGNITGLTGAHHAILDIDRDDYVQPFLDANPWMRAAMQTAGRRGLRVHFRAIAENWPSKTFTLHRADKDGQPLPGVENQIGEVKLAGSLYTLSGFHPSGCEYRIVQALGVLHDARVSDFNFPSGVVPRLSTARPKGDYNTKPGECALGLDKLEGLRDGPGDKLIARCPCCAAHGGDRKAEHLAIWPNGKYWCIKECSTTDIFALVGRKRRKRFGAWRPSRFEPE